MNSPPTIGFIGLGKLGMDCASVFAKHYTTYGYDVQPKTSNSIIIFQDIKEVIERSQWLFIAVPTPHDAKYGGETPSAHLPPKNFDYGVVKSVLNDITAIATTSKKVVLISTVLPGTIRDELAPLLRNVHTLIYNPYLIAMGSTQWDMINPEMVIIGSETVIEPEVSNLIDIYRPMMVNDPRYECGTWEEAEAIKIYYNVFISMKISFANMVQDTAMKIHNINSDVVMNALSKSTKRITSDQYMTPGLGDAGACHPRDNIALRWLTQEHSFGYDLFTSIMRSREVQAKNLAEFVIANAKEYDLPIVIHGKAYKPDVPYTDGSYSLLVGYYIKQLTGKEPLYCDPLTNDTLQPMKAVVLWAHNRDVTYKYTGDTKGDGVYFSILEGSVIIDPWRTINRNNKFYKIIHYGDTRG